MINLARCFRAAWRPVAIAAAFGMVLTILAACPALTPTDGPPPTALGQVYAVERVMTVARADVRAAYNDKLISAEVALDMTAVLDAADAALDLAANLAGSDSQADQDEALRQLDLARSILRTIDQRLAEAGYGPGDGAAFDSWRLDDRQHDTRLYGWHRQGGWLVARANPPGD